MLKFERKLSTHNSSHRNSEKHDFEAAEDGKEGEGSPLVLVCRCERVEVVLQVHGDGGHHQEDDEGEETQDELDDAQPPHEVHAPRHHTTSVHAAQRSRLKRKKDLEQTKIERFNKHCFATRTCTCIYPRESQSKSEEWKHEYCIKYHLNKLFGGG